MRVRKAVGRCTLALALLVASGCTAQQPEPTPEPTTTSAISTTVPLPSETSTPPTTTTPATTATTTTPDRSASYEEAPCPTPNVDGAPQLELGTDFDCGYLIVPENRSDPNSRTIRIAVAKVPAIDPQDHKDQILYLAGGPGGTGIATAVLRVEDGWNRDRDVIFLDQRGTLHSDPLLSCPEVDAFLQSQVGLAVQDPGTGAADAAATAACYQRWAADGVDLGAYNSTENAADIADLRTVLGIDEWNIYGVSYGSDLALQVLRDHPDGIRSVVLDSVVPTEANLLNNFWPNAAAGYTAVFDACAAETGCAAAYPDLRAQFTGLVDSLAATPKTVTVTDPQTGSPTPVVIDGYSLANLVVVQALYPGATVGVPAMIHNLAVGDGSLAAAAMLAARPPTGLTGYGLTFGVFCAEQAAFTNQPQLQTLGKQALPDFPDAVVALTPQVPRIFEDCASWPVPAAPAEVHDPTTSAVPVLVLSGGFDGITTPAFADSISGGLPNATFLTFPGVGHDVMTWSPQCGVEVMINFLDDPDGFDSGCVSSLAPPAFTVS